VASPASRAGVIGGTCDEGPHTSQDVIDPAVAPTVHTRLDFEPHGTLTHGATVVDRNGRIEKPANADVAVGLDVPRFWDLVVGAVNRLPGA
jgi:purine nucleosidase/pyrimidine-specific ribonucleoside hydrolase